MAAQKPPKGAMPIEVFTAFLANKVMENGGTDEVAILRKRAQILVQAANRRFAAGMLPDEMWGIEFDTIVNSLALYGFQLDNFMEIGKEFIYIEPQAARLNEIVYN